MYPFRRQVLDLMRARRLPSLNPGEAHIGHMRVMPWDIDPFGDLNNGRIITLSDIGRISMAYRIGLIAVMRRRRWGLAMAGSAPQYRKRVTVFARLEWQTRMIGLDRKFAYIEHTMLANGTPAANIMCRTVITENRRLVPPHLVAEALGHPDWNPALPDWVQEWAHADDARPWPPEQMR